MNKNSKLDKSGGGGGFFWRGLSTKYPSLAQSCRCIFMIAHHGKARPLKQ